MNANKNNNTNSCNLYMNTEINDNMNIKMDININSGNLYMNTEMNNNLNIIRIFFIY
ncbi:hypothetical protein Yalta_149 [Yalta virus]|nr:hypothetical protein Yalta_149 [Yalta virus]